jgi:hypothetical protein
LLKSVFFITHSHAEEEVCIQFCMHFLQQATLKSTVYQKTCLHISEGLTFHQLSCQYLKSHTIDTCKF